MIERYTASGKLENVRPQFYHHGPESTGKWVTPGITAQLIEDARNVLEEIRDSQMLHCDIAYTIKQMLVEIRGLRRDLKARRRKRG